MYQVTPMTVMTGKGERRVISAMMFLLFLTCELLMAHVASSLCHLSFSFSLFRSGIPHGTDDDYRFVLSKEQEDEIRESFVSEKLKLFTKVRVHELPL